MNKNYNNNNVREQRQTSGNKSMHSVNEVQIDKMSCMDCGFTFTSSTILFYCCVGILTAF